MSPDGRVYTDDTSARRGPHDAPAPTGRATSRVDILIRPAALSPSVSLVTSLPDRALSAGEIAALNRADAVELAVAVDDDGHADGVLLATDAWVKGLAHDDGWTVVETVAVDGADGRYDALRACEDAVRDVRAD